jgi:hypothetical protein
MDGCSCIFQFFCLCISQFFLKLFEKHGWATIIILIFFFGLTFLAGIGLFVGGILLLQLSTLDPLFHEDKWSFQIMISFHIIFGLSAIICEIYGICFGRKGGLGTKMISCHIIFSGIIFVIEIALISALIAGYDTKKDSIKDNFQQAVEKYDWIDTNDENRKIVDNYQNFVRCCGTNSSQIFDMTRPHFLNSDLYPMSCCTKYGKSNEAPSRCKISVNNNYWCKLSCINHYSCFDKNLFMSGPIFFFTGNGPISMSKEPFFYAFIWVVIKLIIVLFSYCFRKKDLF